MTAAPDKRPSWWRLIWRAAKAEAPWLMGLSCLFGGITLLMTALRWSMEGKWFTAALVVLFGVGCIWSWNTLRRMTAADIGLEE